jgi:hypothetical protein
MTAEVDIAQPAGTLSRAERQRLDRIDNAETYEEMRHETERKERLDKEDLARRVRAWRRDLAQRRRVARVASAPPRSPAQRPVAVTTRPREQGRRATRAHGPPSSSNDSDSDLDQRVCAREGCDLVFEVQPDSQRLYHDDACRLRNRVARHRARTRADDTPPTISTALRRRHEMAMRIVRRLDPDERVSLLAAVVWPQDERLLVAA